MASEEIAKIEEEAKWKRYREYRAQVEAEGLEVLKSIGIEGKDYSSMESDEQKKEMLLFIHEKEVLYSALSTLCDMEINLNKAEAVTYRDMLRRLGVCDSGM